MAPMRMRINALLTMLGTSRAAGRSMRSLGVLLAAAVMVLSTPSDAAEGTFTPRVLLGQHWTDNVSLAPKGLKESEWITELKPGFSLALDRPQATAEFDYDLQALWYADNSEFNDAYHQALGKGTFILVPESLFIDAYTRYDQQNIDPGGQIDFSNLFDTQNRTDVFVYGASPYHVRRWGNRVESLVRYRYQAVKFANTDEAAIDLQDSDTHFMSVALGSPTAQPGISWQTRGSYSITEFDEAPDFEYARVALELGVPVGLRARATVTAGRESDVEEDPSGGGLDSTFWYVGFEWAPSELQQLSGRVGERYFGTALELHWTRLGSLGEIGLDYTEEPNTSSGVLGEEDMFVPGFRPGGVPGLDTRVFLRKSLVGRLTYDLPRTTIGGRMHFDRLIYDDDAGGTERYYGATLNCDWQFAPRTALGASISLDRRKFQAGENDQMEFGVAVTRTLSRTLSGSLRAVHQSLNSEQIDDYRVNRVSLYLTGQF